MKLSKQAFYAALSGALVDAGWARMTGPSGTSGLLARREGDLAFMLGFFESTLRGDRVTAEFALGAHTSIIQAFPDMPRARHRVAHFLTADERAELLDPEFCRSGVVDGWWLGRTPENVQRILAAIDTCAPRFLAQEDLLGEIARSARHRAYVSRLRAIADVSSPEVEHARDMASPPESWVVAAEATLSRGSPRQRKATALQLAYDAWRTYEVLQLPRDP